MGVCERRKKKMKRESLSNISLLRVNAWDLIGYILPDNSLYRVHILCPDPWPKKRHRARRLLSSEFLGRLANKILPNGVLHIATDDRNYAAFIKDAITPLSFYGPGSRTLEDDIPDIKTDFEEKFETIGVLVNHMTFRVIKGASCKRQYFCKKLKE